MLLAVAAGRLSDRIGVRRPMLVGSIGHGRRLRRCRRIVPGLPALFVSAIVLGVVVHAVPGARAERDGRNGPARGAIAQLQHAGARLLDLRILRAARRGLHDRPRRVSPRRSRCLRCCRWCPWPCWRTRPPAAARAASGARRAPRAGGALELLRTEAAAAGVLRERAARDRLGPAHDRDPGLRRADRPVGVRDRDHPRVVRRGDVRRALRDALDRAPRDRAPGADRRAGHRGRRVPAVPVLARRARR